MAGQIVMEGFLKLRLRLAFRRLATRLLAIVPALVIALIEGGSGAEMLLVYSQVLLSIQLPFAIIPLVYFTSSPAIMGGSNQLNPASVARADLDGGEQFANKVWLRVVAWSCCCLVVVLNIAMLALQFKQFVSG